MLPRQSGDFAASCRAARASGRLPIRTKSICQEAIARCRRPAIRIEYKQWRLLLLTDMHRAEHEEPSMLAMQLLHPVRASPFEGEFGVGSKW